MKRIVKWGGGLTLAALLVAAALMVQAVYFRPLSIRVFYEKIFIEKMLQDPELLTSLGLLEQFGIHGHNARLTDASPEFTEESARWLTRQLQQLHEYDRASLQGQTALSYDVLNYYLETEQAGLPFRYHNYPVNQMFGVQSQLPTVMTTSQPLASETDAKDYISRLGAFGTKFRQLLRSLKLREEKGILPPRFVVEKVLDEMQAFTAMPPDEHLLYTSFRERMQKTGVDEATLGRLLTQVKAQIRDVVYPAYGQLIGYFRHLQSLPLDNNGVWALPNGKAYYAWLIRANTTTDMSADEIHALGLSEVARIEGEMDRLLKLQGYEEGSVGERMSRLSEEARFLYPDSESGRQQVLKDYQKIIDEMDVRLDTIFDIRPRYPVVVKRIPLFKEKTSAGAYYDAPPMDGSRPGVFYANLYNMSAVRKWGMRTLAYHEAIPGHHFQISIARELKGVATFRRILPFTAYVEGWALYAERLAREIGMEEDPFDDLGRLQAELFRAVRLVVDTGLHARHWTREQAIAYMKDKTGMPETDVVAEVERYLVMPGQALAYKIGMLKILELRDKARTRLGKRFDIRKFHKVILKNGALPLPLLEQQVDAYIARESA
ncbi:DUF885 domain-containing protein [Thiolapillus brandeum]|uniref:DUF885 domain-containing protein n=1 Tax=Thiolapillus brandeum TaxID=1076588 RepID=A0A7U6JI87_9GAMM|nr:DUF885 domain-containing protein [Thiolapillus brandeum]BAO44543.1 conserved hypothetical protein [Thiolapillus brandeum]